MSHESQYRKVQQGIPRVGASPIGADAQRIRAVPELGISRQLLYLWRDTRQRSNKSKPRTPASVCARKIPDSRKRC